MGKYIAKAVQAARRQRKDYGPGSVLLLLLIWRRPLLEQLQERKLQPAGCARLKRSGGGQSAEAHIDLVAALSKQESRQDACWTCSCYDGMLTLAIAPAAHASLVLSVSPGAARTMHAALGQASGSPRGLL